MYNLKKMIKNINLIQKGNKLTEIKFPKSLKRISVTDNITERGLIDNADAKDLAEVVTHKNSMLAVFSHDLRSPLAGIVGTTEYLKSNFEKMDISTVKEMLSLIYESSIKELHLLDYLVEWVRVKYAVDVFSPSKIELVQYVDKVFEILKKNALLNTISLHHEIEENNCVFVDGKMLLSILQNIVSNAIKYSYPNGKITITTMREYDKIIVEIRHSGIGMFKEKQKNIFTTQMVIFSKERIKNKGSGIGLLLVKDLLQKNGGKIWVESMQSVGSSFYFTLPVYNYDDNGI